MVNKERYIGLGLDTDTAPDKRKPDVFWDATNIQILNNSRGLSIKPILGESSILQFDLISGVKPLIVGYTVFDEKIYVFTTINQNPTIPTGISNDKIYVIHSDNSIHEIVSGVFNFCIGNRIDAVANYETEDIIKLYWVDGVNQLRYLNVATYPVTLSRYTKIDIVDVVELSTPTVTLSSGGSLVAGTIQYAFNYYNQHGSQSTLSPLSPLLSIAEYFKGGVSLEDMGLKTKIVLDNLDGVYDAIKVYSIHYQELNQSPIISLIFDGALQGLSTLTLYDGGTSPISSLSVSDLLALIASPYVPNTLGIKRDRLFLANYSNTNYNPDVDMRAYSYASTVTTGTYLTGGVITALHSNAALAILASTHDAINPDFAIYKYKSNGSTLGGSGINIEYEYIVTSPVTNVTPPMSLKQNEMYRIGIKLLNALGQSSPVKWVADIKIPDQTTIDKIVGLHINLTSAGVTALTNAGAVSYQLCIVERKPEDRTILAQGFIVPSVRYQKDGQLMSPYYFPYYITKDIQPSDFVTYTNGGGGNIQNSYAPVIPSPSLEFIDFFVTPGGTGQDDTVTEPVKTDKVVFFYSSDTMFDTTMPKPDKIRILGTAICSDYDLSGNVSWKEYQDDKVVASLSTTKYDTHYPIIGEVPFCTMSISQVPGNVSKIYVQELVLNKIYQTTAKKTTVTEVVLDTSNFLQEGQSKVIDANYTVSNSCSFNPLITSTSPYPPITTDGTIPMAYISVFAPSMVLTFSSATWHGSTYYYDKFDVTDIYGTAAYGKGLPLVELLQTVVNQYGGNTYEAKQRNEYLTSGTLHPVAVTHFNEYIGDIWVAPLSINRADATDSKIHGALNHYEYVHLPYLENNHNVIARSDNMNKWRSQLLDTNNYNYYRVSDNHKLLGAYNQKATLIKAYALPYNFNIEDKNPVSVCGSNAKNPNEIIDQWLIFNANNVKLLEGQYGSITKLHNIGGDLLALQKTGISMLSVEPRIQTQGDDGITISLGIGALLYDHRYLTTVVGCQNKFTVVDDGKSLYYYDGIQNTINTLSEGKLSTLKTVKRILDENPLGPNSTTFFNNKDQIYFHYDDFTLVYDLLLQKFLAKYILLNGNKWVIPIGSTCYQIDDSGVNTILYTQFTGDVKESSITYLMCPEPIYEKVFHNLEYRLEGSNFTTIKVDNVRSSSGTVLIDSQTKFDIHRVHLPRVADSRERWRGIYILVELNNTGNYALDDMVLMYNIKG